MGVEQRYSNIEHEVLGILHDLEKFYHYCFGREVLVITDHKPLVSMFKKDVATLSQCMQHILLKIQQYRVQIIYKPGPKIFIEDWLSRYNHTEGKDKPIKGIDIQVDAIQTAMDMPECILMAEIQHALAQDNHLQQLKILIITGWLDSREKVCEELWPYWSYRDEVMVIDGVILKGRCIIMPNSLWQQVLNQLHTNHMGIEKTKLLAYECVYWPSINADIEKYIKQCPTCLEFQQMQPKERIIHHDIPLRPWEVIRADVFHFNNKNYLCAIDYNSKFPIMKRLEGLSAENLINTVKIIFAKYGIPYKIMSDAGTNFVSDRFQQFCKTINVEQAVSSVYHHQSNGQVEACIKFIKCTFKKCVESSSDINMALLHICTTQLDPGLLSPATLMFNRQVQGIMPVLHHKLVGQDCDDDHHSKLVDRQYKNDNDTSPIFPYIPIVSAVVVQ